MTWFEETGSSLRWRTVVFNVFTTTIRSKRVGGHSTGPSREYVYAEEEFTRSFVNLENAAG
ncbi:MAG: hypothetical protein QXE77_03940 [Desulfurococcaceae archaeon]